MYSNSALLKPSKVSLQAKQTSHYNNNMSADNTMYCTALVTCFTCVTSNLPGTVTILTCTFIIAR